MVVNLAVLVVPIAGLEFARLYERQLLDALERDMRDQAVLVRELVVEGRAAGREDAAVAPVLVRAARRTRTRVRVLDAAGGVVADSHAGGAPEGPEPPPPAAWSVPSGFGGARTAASAPGADRAEVPAAGPGASWPEVPARAEVRAALAGAPSARTRVRASPPAVFLFVGEPVPGGGAVYVTRSTQPVLVELYRIRAGLFRVLTASLIFTALITLVLAWTISRPLSRLARAASRVAAGQRDVEVPIGGGGELRELGEAVARMKDRLEERLRYIEAFAADVAHEFKSPLTAIRGAAELLEEGAADDPAARARFLRNIGDDVERLDRLVSRLLELSRIEASREAMTVVDLGALVHRAAERARTPDVDVRVQWRAARQLVRGRETDLDTAVGNLLDNAVRFSPPGAAVDVVVTDAGPDRLAIEVRDRGPGIAPEHLPKVFDRFFTTDADRNGTGLGLAIVRSVAELHGGAVSASSAPGGGACFRLTLPRGAPGLEG
jgi:two-component system sensor histidine kinase ChvG